MSSDSDDEIGRMLDESSSDDEPRESKKKRKQKKKKEKEVKEVRYVEVKPKKEKIPQPPQPPPANSPPPKQRLTAGRRNQIIQMFQIGKEDPEYSVTKLANGSFRVSKRKEFYTPSASVESTSPKDSNIPLTWMNMQNEVNEGLNKQLKKLKLNYAKLSEKYEERNTQPPQPTPTPPPQQPPQPPPKEEPKPTPTPPPQPPPPQPQIPQPIPPSQIQPSNQVLRKPIRKGRTYAGGIQSIRDY
jgi:hypothetical protein